MEGGHDMSKRNVYSTNQAAGKGRLVIVPTPLGNLGDVSKRAMDALSAVDVVACEDTRVTGKLLSALGISGAKLERMDEATLSRKGLELVERIAVEGISVAYCTDAGMPGISDPGQRLIDQAYARHVPVAVLPGATAASTAYVASGFSCPAFYFGAFAPRKASERKRLFESLKELDAALVFYDSPHRIADTLSAVAAAFPLRQVAVCRELSKLHEETVRGLAPDVAAEFAARAEEGRVRGEFVFVVNAPDKQEAQQDALSNIEAARALIAEEKEAGTLTNKDLVQAVRDVFGLSRNEAYALVNEE